LGTLCGSDPTTPLVITAFDWDSDGSHDVIGSVTTSLKDMQERAEKGSSPLALVNPKKAGKKGYSNSGQLIIKKANVVRVPTFLDFVGGVSQL
jgi:copine 1/2/3